MINNEDLLNSEKLSLKDSNEFNEAIKNFDKVLDVDPNNINALNLKGYSLAKLGKFEEAIGYFNKVHELDPDNKDASKFKRTLEFVEMADALKIEGIPLEKLIETEDALNLKGYSLEKLFKNLGNLGEINEIIKCFDKIPEKNSSNVIDMPNYSEIEDIGDLYEIPVFNEIKPLSSKCSSLSEAIQEILFNEHPVHIMHLSKLLLPYLKQKRVTDEVKDQVMSKIKKNKLGIIDGSFLYLDVLNTQMNTNSSITPRIPNTRPIEHISQSELMEGMFIIVDKSFTHTKESLFNETGKLFGFKHINNKFLDDPFKELLNSKRIFCENGTIKNYALKICQDNIHELKKLYEHKEKFALNMIESYFGSSEVNQGKFIGELNSLGETILKEIDSSLNFINMGIGNTKNVIDEIEEQVNEIKSLIDGMDNFATELETIHKYKNIIEDLKVKYQDKEKSVCDTVKSYFSTEEEICDRFVGELIKLNKSFSKEITTVFNIINGGIGNTDGALKEVEDKNKTPSTEQQLICNTDGALKEVEEKVNVIESLIDDMDDFTTELETIHKYKNIILDLKVKYQDKEKFALNMIESYFGSSEVNQGKFIGELNSLGETILKEIDSSLNFINMEIGNTKNVIDKIEEQVNEIKSLIGGMDNFATELETIHKYKNIIEDLKVKYQDKEDIGIKLIKERFPSPQMTYDRFMDEIGVCNEIFYNRLELASDIINMAPGLTKKVLNELKERVEILKSIKEEIENLVVELTINSNNSSDISDDEVKNLLEDMKRLNSSVKEYK
ncbi:MAG: conserved hypothetical protein [Methanobrevibacter sp. CfCl-M3]